MTSTNEPAQGHHGSHDKPKAPYGREVQSNNEQAKQQGKEPSEPAEDEGPTGAPR